MTSIFEDGGSITLGSTYRTDFVMSPWVDIHMTYCRKRLPNLSMQMQMNDSVSNSMTIHTYSLRPEKHVARAFSQFSPSNFPDQTRSPPCLLPRSPTLATALPPTLRPTPHATLLPPPTSPPHHVAVASPPTPPPTPPARSPAKTEQAARFDFCRRLVHLRVVDNRLVSVDLIPSPHSCTPPLPRHLRPAAPPRRSSFASKPTPPSTPCRRRQQVDDAVHSCSATAPSSSTSRPSTPVQDFRFRGSNSGTKRLHWMSTPYACNSNITKRLQQGTTAVATDQSTGQRLHCTFFFRDDQQRRIAAQHEHELHRQAWSMGERARTRAWVAAAPVFGHRRSYLRAPMAASGRPPRPGEPATNR
ncbi:serine/arginine repetitive matrix protein 1 [Triticum aestivum]|uniref:serine/arginine repetitive matrix protein 1 n=1 Tax=Triticum aestivum TaxID=4565 RepID=UPI001D01F8E8|nr:serine/arginine repetitive matrix protein 1-like [Triticum aestivum]